MQKTTTLVHITTVPRSLDFLSGQFRYFSKKGFTIQAISSSGEMLQKYEQTESIQVHAVEMARRITPFRDLVALWRLYRILRSIRPEIVHTHTPKASLLGGLAAWMANVPVRIHTLHGLPMMTATGLKRTILRWSEILSCWCVHQVLSVSRSVMNVAIQERMCSPTKIKVLMNGSSNGIDAFRKFNPKNYNFLFRAKFRTKLKIPISSNVLGFVGRIVRDKGMIELAQAWLKLREEYPNLHLLLIGPFEPQDPLPKDVETLFQSDPRIHLTGRVTNTAPYYAAIDVLVFPTYREGLPGVPLEASAMNLPVVATRIPGCVNAIKDGETGILVPVHDTEALTDAVRQYLSSPSLRRMHGHAGRKFVISHFQTELIWQALYKEYTNLLQKNGLSIPPITQANETDSLKQLKAA
jgi:glycosyltransferase involved in cell wall biosynthesis